MTTDTKTEAQKAEEAAAAAKAKAEAEQTKAADKARESLLSGAAIAHEAETTVKDGKEIKEQGFVFATHLDPARQIPGTNPYLDDVQRAQAEVQRAAVEGRKPDLKNPPATQGTPLKTVDELRADLPASFSIKPDFTQEIVVGATDEKDTPKTGADKAESK